MLYVLPDVCVCCLHFEFGCSLCRARLVQGLLFVCCFGVCGVYFVLTLTVCCVLRGACGVECGPYSCMVSIRRANPEQAHPPRPRTRNHGSRSNWGDPSNDGLGMCAQSFGRSSKSCLASCFQFFKISQNLAPNPAPNLGTNFAKSCAPCGTIVRPLSPIRAPSRVPKRAFNFA